MLSVSEPGSVSGSLILWVLNCWPDVTGLQELAWLQGGGFGSERYEGGDQMSAQMAQVAQCSSTTRRILRRAFLSAFKWLGLGVIFTS